MDIRSNFATAEQLALASKQEAERVEEPEEDNEEELEEGEEEEEENVDCKPAWYNDCGKKKKSKGTDKD